jgi:FHA domain
MHRLIVNPGTETAWEIPLQPGVILLGRGEANDFPVEHSSISTTHCQITVMNSGVIVKDLGSINGTFIDGKRIDETLLLPGQTLQLGDVIMQLETDPQVPAKIISLAAPATATATQTFARLIGGAFAYPFKHDGAILLIAGTVFYLVINFLISHAMMFGFLLMIFGTGYLFNYMQRILTASAMGKNRMPDWPDFTDWSDVTGPFIQVLGTIIFSFGPAILVRVFAPADAAWTHWALIGAIIFGCFYFPMSFTAVAMFDSLGALNPLLIIFSMLKIPAAYLFTVSLLFANFVLIWAGNSVLAAVLPIPFLPGAISEFLGLYLLTVEMRILGLLYWTKKDDLGWFSLK